MSFAVDSSSREDTKSLGSSHKISSNPTPDCGNELGCSEEGVCTEHLRPVSSLPRVALVSPHLLHSEQLCLLELSVPWKGRLKVFVASVNTVCLKHSRF